MESCGHNKVSTKAGYDKMIMKKQLARGSKLDEQHSNIWQESNAEIIIKWNNLRTGAVGKAMLTMTQMYCQWHEHRIWFPLWVQSGLIYKTSHMEYDISMDYILSACQQMYSHMFIHAYSLPMRTFQLQQYTLINERSMQGFPKTMFQKQND